ncbi:hypothetical protein Lrub_0370 [Legionella rubrilucens]|uniref:Uncharacterized protein n=1 Tax=Legionella rubrilucens TaxID=458 RepID=A0A0W0XZQ1_9GAMM|nr:hypothetical protein [Legionella rubrilucens]KTD49742.1 hypothetical protein Lrub_0370 [Legionella rubrilucens]
MLVSRIHEFLILFSNKEQPIHPGDAALIDEMGLKYASLSPDSALKEQDFNALLGYYAKRWEGIVDGDADYTFNASGVNQPWVDLAQDLGRELKKSYLEVLMPVTRFDPDSFSKISSHSPSSLFLGDDDKTWHSVEALIKQLKLTGMLAIHDIPKDISPRILSIKEMYRLQSKTGEGLSFNLGNKQYESFWDYLLNEIAPGWKKSEDYSPQLLMSLLDVLNAVENKNPKELRFALLNLQAEINNCTLKQASNFYGLKFIYQNKSIYLFEILIACWKNDADIEDKLVPVAQWLSVKNPAFISTSPAFSTGYEAINAGPFFTISNLEELLNQLDCRPYAHLNAPLQKIRDMLKKKSTIDKEVSEEIAALFKSRWNSIIDTSNDYLRLTSDVNKGWITLAQRLAGAGLINRNYYRILIPSLSHDTDPITAVSLMAYPLTSFILSNDGTQLILLTNCVYHHKTHGTFYNCNPQVPVPLTLKEEQRLKFTKFYDDYLRAEEGKSIPAIQKSTVEALTKLVNGALHPIGLIYGKEYTLKESVEAEIAYGEFNEFVRTLPEDERERLYQQKITWRQDRYTVAQIMFDIQKGKSHEDTSRECVAVYTKHLAKLVCDYNPQAELKKFSELKDMQAFSARRVYRSYDGIDEEEATRRVLIIMVSLMTHKFNCALAGGYNLSLWDSSNSVTKTGSELFAAAEEALKNGTNNMRFVYASIMENIIIPALQDERVRTVILRSTDTHEWLQSVKNGSLFDSNRTAFDPKILVVVLSELATQKPELRKSMENFIEEALHTLAQNQNNYQIWIRVNIKLVDLLTKLGTQKEDVLRKLRGYKLESPHLFYEKVFDFLLYRCVYQKFKNQHGGFFTPDVDHGVQSIKNKLGEVKFNNLADLSFTGVLKKFSEVINSNVETSQHRSFLNEYIEKTLGLEISEKPAHSLVLYSS